jgi:hypothetical protein
MREAMIINKLVSIHPRMYVFHAFMDETMTMALCYYIIMNTKKTCESLALLNGEHAFMDENMRKSQFVATD